MMIGLRLEMLSFVTAINKVKRKENIMNLNLQFIKKNSMQVYGILIRYTRCTFEQLEKLCNLTSTDLCLALAQLMREKKIEQFSECHAVYYRPALLTV